MTVLACAAFVVMSFASCTTPRGAERYYNKHPDKLMAHAARLAPNIDSVGTPYIEQHTPANNIDYTGQIDSLEQEAQKAKDLVDSLLGAVNTQNPVPSIDQGKAKLQKQVGSLLAQVQQLKAQYKPCEPDTAKIIQPIYRELGYKLADLRYQLGAEVKRREGVQLELQTAVVKGDKWKAQRDQLLWILIMIAGGVVIWGFIKLRPKIPILGRL